MKIIVEMQHPAHVHQFRNLINELKNRGHKTQVITTDKEITLDLLNFFDMEYNIIGTTHGKGLLKKISFMVSCCINTYKIAKQYNPDIYISRRSPFSGIISKLSNKPHIAFSDTDHISPIVSKITTMLTDVTLTPSCYRRNLGKKQVCIEGYKELMYLHPNYFTPNPAVLDELGLTEDDIFIIMRFVSWGAYHDAGHSGLSLEDKRKAVSEFSKYGKVLISSEKPLPSDLEKYRFTLSPEKMHDLLYYCALLYGESATMASECAVLGTHAIFCDYAGRGYTDEQEKYGLVFNFYDEKTMGKESLEKALELLDDSDLKENGREKRNKLLEDKIDVTQFMVDFIENYTTSETNKIKGEL